MGPILADPELVLKHAMIHAQENANWNVLIYAGGTVGQRVADA